MKPVALIPAVLALLVFSGACFGEEKFLGTWGDRNEANVYVFRANGDFEFHRRKAGPVGEDASAAGGKGEPASYERIAGVWTSGKGICSTALQKGNVMLYVEEMQCCTMMQVVAEKLVLSTVFSLGQDDLSLCRNRVLSRLEGWPDARGR